MHFGVFYKSKKKKYIRSNLWETSTQNFSSRFLLINCLIYIPLLDKLFNSVNIDVCSTGDHRELLMDAILETALLNKYFF